MTEVTLLGIFLIPISVFVFFKLFGLAADQQEGPAKPRYKIETRADGSGPYYFVYRHLGFPAGWSVTPSFVSKSFHECEAWVARAKVIREDTVYK
jgi:hypothetical protein